MAEFAADSVEALPDFSVQDYTAPDPGADRNEHAGRSARADARVAFRKGGYVRVVIDVNRFVQVSVEFAAKRNVLPAHIGAFVHSTVFQRDTGNADAHGNDIVRREARFPDYRVNAGSHLPDLLFKREL